MVFNSYEFFGFFLILVLAYGFVREKCRWVFLLIVSLAFYCISCFAGLIYILMTSVSVWFCSCRISYLNEAAKVGKMTVQNTIEKRKKGWFFFALLLNLGTLGMVKYFNFIAGNLYAALGMKYHELSFLVPLGISFYTFQALGYLTDVYREQITAQKNYGKVLLFTCYFPQMIDGPISRYEDISGRLYNPLGVEYGRCRDALILFVWGLFKKICVADNVKIFADMVFGGGV